jgi:coenzyme F420 hydrogenase subunit delta
MLGRIYDKSVLIFGCGNVLFGDDGFGPAVIDHLQEHYALPPQVLLMDVGTGIRDILFDLVLSQERPQKLMVIDAVDLPFRKPGEVFELPVEKIPANKSTDFSLHQFPTVNLLKELQDHTGMEIRILAAQIESIPDEVSPGLSPALEAAVAKACDCIAQSLSLRPLN